MTLSPFEILALPGLASSATKTVGHALDALMPGGSTFAKKLAEAQQSDAQLPVDIGKGVEVELTSEQLKRIADAVDRAEQEGASHAAIMIDGLALEVDVTMRTIRSVIDQEGGLVSQIDAIVYADKGSPETHTQLPGTLAGNADVRHILSGQQNDDAA